MSIEPFALNTVDSEGQPHSSTVLRDLRQLAADVGRSVFQPGTVGLLAFRILGGCEGYPDPALREALPYQQAHGPVAHVLEAAPSFSFRGQPEHPRFMHFLNDVLAVLQLRNEEVEAAGGNLTNDRLFDRLRRYAEREIGATEPGSPDWVAGRTAVRDGDQPGMGQLASLAPISHEQQALLPLSPAQQQHWIQHWKSLFVYHAARSAAKGRPATPASWSPDFLAWMLQPLLTLFADLRGGVRDGAPGVVEDAVYLMWRAAEAWAEEAMQVHPEAVAHAAARKQIEVSRAQAERSKAKATGVLGKLSAGLKGLVAAAPSRLPTRKEADAADAAFERRLKRELMLQYIEWFATYYVLHQITLWALRGPPSKGDPPTPVPLSPATYAPDGKLLRRTEATMRATLRRWEANARRTAGSKSKSRSGPQ